MSRNHLEQLKNLATRLENAIYYKDVTEAGNLAIMLSQLKVAVIVENVPNSENEIK